MSFDSNVDGDSQSEHYEPDPVFLSSRREAVLVLVIFAVFAVYVLGVSYLLSGWQAAQGGEPVATIMGLPVWVFWGIVVPWIVANGVTAWFCFRFLQHDVLDDSDEAKIDLEQSRD